MLQKTHANLVARSLSATINADKYDLKLCEHYVYNLYFISMAIIWLYLFKNYSL